MESRALAAETRAAAAEARVQALLANPVQIPANPQTVPQQQAVPQQLEVPVPQQQQVPTQQAATPVPVTTVPATPTTTTTTTPGQGTLQDQQQAQPIPNTVEGAKAMLSDPLAAVNVGQQAQQLNQANPQQRQGEGRPTLLGAGQNIPKPGQGAATDALHAQIRHHHRLSMLEQAIGHEKKDDQQVEQNPFHPIG